jgi:hypothetical protein
MVTTDNFGLRQNRDSTTDLICLSCFRTVATVKHGVDLAAIETTHTCHPLELDQERYIDSQRGTF